MANKRKNISDFSAFSIDDMKTNAKHKSVLLVHKFSVIAERHQYLQNMPKSPCNFIEKKLHHRRFSAKFPKCLKTFFLTEHL